MGLPFLLLKKEFREGFFQLVFRTKESISRVEYEAREKTLWDAINRNHDDLSEKISANGAQARQDNRDLRDWMERQFSEQFRKIDGFTTLVSMVRAERERGDGRG
ncbi:MAG: hypothetical protein KGJ07_08670 [Patescibacteria group bacterium]|nr:hypothetical protein [Patescibacteria group bacterium]